MSERVTDETKGSGADAPGAGRPAEDVRAKLSLLARASEVRNIGLILVLIVVCLVGLYTAPANFATTSNLLTILRAASVIGVVTVGMTFVIIGGGIDLSVGALVALASVWATTTAAQGGGVWAMVGIALVIGALAGLINGVLIAYGRVVAFIATLAMLVSARGFAQRLSDKRTQIVTVDSFRAIGRDDLFGIPILVLVFAAVVAVGWVLLNRTTFGRRTFAIGGNIEAARLAGINVRRQTMLLYVVSGVCAAIAAVMIAARTTTGSSTHGELYELDAIAAVIIGGTLLSGGKGTLIGSTLGVLIFTTITNIFVLNNLSTDLQNIAKGLIIVAAVLLQARAGRGGRTP
jgi:ribose transport system permease protein